MLAILGGEAVFHCPSNKLGETIGTHLSDSRVTTIGAIFIAAASLVHAATPRSILPHVLGVVDRELSCSALCHVEAIYIRLSPRLKLLMGFFIVAVKNANHG
jgi:hypothetical protein